MTEAELVRQAIWDAAQKLIDRDKSKYASLSDSVLKKINLITSQAIAFLDLYSDFKKSIYASATLMKHTGDQEKDFNSKTNAIESLHAKSTEVVSISSRQMDVRRDVLNKLWNDDLLLAAGRLMRSASLGVDHDPEDMGIVDEAKRRGPLLVVFTNKVYLGIEGNSSGNDPIDHAFTQVPAKAPIVWAQTKHPLEPDDDEHTTFFKEGVSQALWTKEVLLAAGRITAARSLALRPSWDDVEKTGRANHIGRLCVVKLKASILKIHTEDEEITSPVHFMRKTISEVENSLKAKRPIDQAILYAIQEKVAQSVWVSYPELFQARANLDKHGNYFTAHGDMMLVHRAHNMEIRLINAVGELLMEKEQKRIDETQSSFFSWFWRSSTATPVAPQHVSDKLNDDLLESEIENQARIVKWVARSQYVMPLTTWLLRKQNTLQLTPDDVTNDLIDLSVKRAIDTSKKQKEDKLEQEEKCKARETSWW